MRLLLLDDQTRSIINQLVDYARLHPISLETLKKGLVVGDDPNFVCAIPDGFRVVFSFERQPVGWCRHLSVSIPDKTKLPSVEAVEMIMHELGFTGAITDLDNVWIDDKYMPHSVNAVQIVKDDLKLNDVQPL